MYPSIRTRPELTPPTGTTPERKGWLRVGPNVFFLGLTSLVTDISSEMVAAILPLYLIFQLGLTPLQFGVFNGVYQAALGLIAIATAFAADRRRRYKEIAAFGYGLSDVCKLGMLAVGTAPFAASLVLLVDRAGKGIRTSPRDALISLSVAPARLATAFGVHRAMDTAGALIGPLVAFLILDGAPQGVRRGVRRQLPHRARRARHPAALRAQPPARAERRGATRPSLVAFGSSRCSRCRRCARSRSPVGCWVSSPSATRSCTSRCSAGPTSSRRTFPLLYVGTAFGYLVLAVPLGRLADRWGRSKMFLSGYVALAAGVRIPPGPVTGHRRVHLRPRPDGRVLRRDRRRPRRAR